MGYLGGGLYSLFRGFFNLYPKDSSEIYPGRTPSDYSVPNLYKEGRYKDSVENSRTPTENSRTPLERFDRFSRRNMHQGKQRVQEPDKKEIEKEEEEPSEDELEVEEAEEGEDGEDEAEGEEVEESLENEEYERDEETDLDESKFHSEEEDAPVEEVSCEDVEDNLSERALEDRLGDTEDEGLEAIVNGGNELVFESTDLDSFDVQTDAGSDGYYGVDAGEGAADAEGGDSE